MIEAKDLDVLKLQEGDMLCVRPRHMTGRNHLEGLNRCLQQWSKTNGVPILLLGYHLEVFVARPEEFYRIGEQDND